MTLISILVNKFLILIGAADVAAAGSSSATLFGIFALAFIAMGVSTLINKRPAFGRYREYTPESVAAAAPLLGISDIVLGILDVIIGVVKAGSVPIGVIAAAAGVVLTAFIVILTTADRKLEKR